MCVVEHLVTSFLVVFPIFIKLVIGFTLKKTGILSESASKDMNNIVFRLFIPVMLFSNIYKADFNASFSGLYILFGLGSLLVFFLFYMLVVPHIEKDNRKRGVLVQAICRSNFVLFGLPVSISIYGEQSAGIASILVGFVVPLINTLSVIALEYFRESKPNIPKILKSIATNPIIIGGLCGFLCKILGVELPSVINGTVSELARIATPLALIILGGSVTFSSVGTNRKQLVFGVLNRLLVIPAVGLAAAVLLGFRNVQLVVLMSMFASPAAVSSFTMAQQMDGDADLAGQLVVFTTVFSIISIFFWTFLLKALGLI